MKTIILICAICFSLVGCDSSIDITPNIKEVTYEVPSISVFIGTLDGVYTDFRAIEYTCSLADYFLYHLPEYSAVLNSDSTQVSCLPDTVIRVTIKETDRPLYVTP